MGEIKILKASAGSGKTYQLAYNYIRQVIENPLLYRNILAVTFTNKATEEMKKRIIEEVNRLASGAPSGYMDWLQQQLSLSEVTVRERAMQARTLILHNYTHFTVVTIDKFFQRILRAFIKELGLELDFSLELQTDSILERATDRMIEAMADNPTLCRWIVRFAEEKIDQNGKWDVRREIIQLGGELFKEQYERLNIHPMEPELLDRTVRQMIAQTEQITQEWKQIADQAIALIDGAGYTPEAFAFGMGGCVGYFYKMREGRFEPCNQRVRDVLSGKKSWVVAKCPASDPIRELIPPLQELLQQLCERYDRQSEWVNTVRMIRANYRTLALLGDLSEQIAQLCGEEHLMPISETHTIIGKLIEGNDTPFIYEKVGNLFSHFMIDEFQDTSAQQWANFTPLLENALAQAEGESVLLVGDVKQSIYRWRGGDWQILSRGVRERFPQLSEHNLEMNFRSMEQIVTFNNCMIGACVSQDNEALNEILQQARGEERLSVAGCAELTDMLDRAYQGFEQRAKADSSGGHVVLTEYDKEDPQSQPQAVIETLTLLQQQGYAPGEIAILVRTNAQAQWVAQQLLDHKAQHPDSPYCFDVVTQEALQIGGSECVGFIIAVLRMAVDPSDRIRQGIYNRFLGLPLGAERTPEETAWLHRLRLFALEEAFEEILLRYHLNDRTSDIAYIQALEEQIHTFGTSRVADIPLFLQWWDETGVTQSLNLPQNREAITILTIHKSKGLQYPAVLIPFCEWSLLPKPGTLLWARTDREPCAALGYIPFRWSQEIAQSYYAETYYRELILSHIDNLNLFYVAATRAEQELHLFYGSGTHKEVKSIRHLIQDALVSQAENRVQLGTEQGRVVDQPWGRCYHFGEPVTPCRTSQDTPELLSEYPVSFNRNALKFRLSSQRYFEQEPSTPSLRSYGVMMHRVFEQIRYREEIAPQLARMRTEGELSASEAEELKRRIVRAMENPQIASWFDVRWSQVLNEHSILVPQDATQRRPDRVLTRGTEATVVDYKFGHRRVKAHGRQIASYMALLQRMGYREVHGYLWYVELEEVEEVCI